MSSAATIALPTWCPTCQAPWDEHRIAIEGEGTTVTYTLERDGCPNELAAGTSRAEATDYLSRFLGPDDLATLWRRYEQHNYPRRQLLDVLANNRYSPAARW